MGDSGLYCHTNWYTVRRVGKMMTIVLKHNWGTSWGILHMWTLPIIVLFIEHIDRLHNADIVAIRPKESPELSVGFLLNLASQTYSESLRKYLVFADIDSKKKNPQLNNTQRSLILWKQMLQKFSKWHNAMFLIVPVTFV